MQNKKKYFLKLNQVKLDYTHVRPFDLVIRLNPVQTSSDNSLNLVRPHSFNLYDSNTPSVSFSYNSDKYVCEYHLHLFCKLIINFTQFQHYYVTIIFQPQFLVHVCSITKQICEQTMHEKAVAEISRCKYRFNYII